MIEIRIDVNEALLVEASRADKDKFLTSLFLSASTAITDYGAQVDSSDPMHWVIRVPESNEKQVRKLLAGV